MSVLRYFAVCCDFLRCAGTCLVIRLLLLYRVFWEPFFFSLAWGEIK